MYEKTYPSKRFNITLDFLKKHISTHESILDLGVTNPFSKIMTSNGYQVINTKGEDIDIDQSTLQNENYEVFTAFEIFEHLLNPYTILQNVKADKILISIPLCIFKKNCKILSCLSASQVGCGLIKIILCLFKTMLNYISAWKNKSRGNPYFKADLARTSP